MPIPVGSYYQKKELGNGKVGTTETPVIDTITAGEDINFGVALAIKDGKAVTATKAPIYGIAVSRDYLMAEHFTTEALANDHWYQDEKIGALRKGGLSVPITEDVNRYDPATINADGTFRVAKQGEEIVGRFKTDGNADSTAIVQIEVTDTGKVEGSAGTSNTEKQKDEDPNSAQPVNQKDENADSSKKKEGNK